MSGLIGSQFTNSGIIGEPVGHILQTITGTTTSGYNSTNSTGQATNLACVITRLAGSSKYIGQITTEMTTLSANVRGGVRVKSSDGTTIESWWSIRNWSDAASSSGAFGFIIDSPPSGTETYTVWTHSEDSTVFWFNYDTSNGPSVFTISEIQEAA